MSATLELEFRVEDDIFQHMLEEYAHATRKSFGEVIQKQARLLCINLAINTQPFRSAGNFTDKGIYTGEQDRLMGENRIIGEVFGGAIALWGAAKNYKYNGLFAIADQTMLDMAERDEKGRLRATDRTVRIFQRKDGTTYAAEKTLFRPAASTTEMHTFHKKYRTKNGRVTTAGLKDGRIGRSIFVSRMIVTEQSAARYIAFIKKRVGFGKGGWAAAARDIGGTRGLPGWVTRHRRAPGHAENYATAFNDPHVILHNNVPYAPRICNEGSRISAFQFQRRKMMTEIERVMNPATRKFNAAA